MDLGSRDTKKELFLENGNISCFFLYVYIFQKKLNQFSCPISAQKAHKCCR